ncbi:MAG TPA: thioredoxin family protein [Chitinophagaceae bacterium]
MIKKIVLRSFFAILIVPATIFAQNQYEISPDRDGGKIFKGILSREVLEKDTSFYNKWYAANFKAYLPNADAVTALKKNSDSLQIVAFMGTWCEDSHFIIPKLFSLLDAAGYPGNKISLIGTDRNKKTLGYLSEAMNVTLVPTIIIMKNGKEIGRVIEYGKYGLFDKELAEIINAVSPASR